jgi:hypothetical protein
VDAKCASCGDEIFLKNHLPHELTLLAHIGPVDAGKLYCHNSTLRQISENAQKIHCHLS